MEKELSLKFSRKNILISLIVEVAYLFLLSLFIFALVYFYTKGSTNDYFEGQIDGNTVTFIFAILELFFFIISCVLAPTSALCVMLYSFNFTKKKKIIIFSVSLFIIILCNVTLFFAAYFPSFTSSFPILSLPSAFITLIGQLSIGSFPLFIAMIIKRKQQKEIIAK